MNICILVSSLRCGGTERTVSLLANAWVRSGQRVEVLTLSGPEVPPFFPLETGVLHKPLDLQSPARTPLHGILNNVRRVLRIRRELRRSRPDVLVAFMEGTTILALLAAAGTRIPVVISEVAVPALQQIGPLWNRLRKLLYPRARAFIVPTKGVQSYFEQQFGFRCMALPNPVEEPPPASVSAASGLEVIAAGRLSPEKGFDMLLRSWTTVQRSTPEARLTIFGEGPERETLQQLAVELGVADSVAFPGNTSALAQEFEKAAMFVLSSRYEGFGNVLCEAMASGRAVVSFDCPTGPREIIRDGIDGVLVPPGDVEKLAEAITTLLGQPERRAALGRQARAVLDRYGLTRVAAQWLEVFEQAQRKV